MEFRVQGSEIRIQSSELLVSGSEIRVQNSGFISGYKYQLFIILSVPKIG